MLFRFRPLRGIRDTEENSVFTCACFLVGFVFLRKVFLIFQASLNFILTTTCRFFYILISLCYHFLSLCSLMERPLHWELEMGN